jgi:hypothetical protein
MENDISQLGVVLYELNQETFCIGGGMGHTGKGPYFNSDGSAEKNSGNSCRLDGMIASLKNIQEMAMDHPSFNSELFLNRDFYKLTDIGGDECDWTMIAIIASEGLES